jgi:hypothetical protein
MGFQRHEDGAIRLSLRDGAGVGIGHPNFCHRSAGQSECGQEGDKLFILSL